jgi:hypothetical protein
MSSDDPKTLLVHPSKAEGNRGRAAPRSIENMLRFAALKLREIGTVERRDKVAALNDEGNPAHHAAWLERHAVKAADILKRVPPDLQAVLREMWTHAFHSGARHESISIDHLYLRTVRGQKSRTRKLAEARQASANRRQKFSDAKLKAMKAAGLTKKGLAKVLGVIRQAIDKRERRPKKL